MEIKAATIDDCYAIAELGQMAGDGIPGYFWAMDQQVGETVLQTGARKAESETDNFSYHNASIAWLDGQVAGMMLAYKLPSAEDNAEDPLDFPEFVQPLVELEQCVPESFYINMLAAYPEFRGRGVGTALMGVIDELASGRKCAVSSIEVFDYNTGAWRLYERLGYEVVEQRRMIAHQCHPHECEVLLMTRRVSI